MSRFFSFGCSCTNYLWSTWADILGSHYDHYENWGQSGAGNFFIFSSLLECYNKNKFTADDTIGIMWSSTSREDRYINNKWMTPGDVYAQSFYDSNFVKKYFDHRGSLIRDLTFVTSAINLLDHWGVKYFMFSMVPFDSYLLFDEKNHNSDITNFYNSYLKKIKPSIYETIFNYDWNSGFNEVEYNFHANKSWPSYENYLNGNYKTEEVRAEIQKFKQQYLEIKSKIKSPSLLKQIRDPHPRPVDYLNYIKKTCPEIYIKPTIEDYIVKEDNLIRTNKHYKKINSLPITRL